MKQWLPIVALVGGAFVGWKVGERVGDGTAAEVVGAVVGGGVGYYFGKKL